MANRGIPIHSEDNKEEVVSPSKSGVKRRLAAGADDEKGGFNSRKKPRASNDDTIADDGDTNDKEKKTQEKKARVDSWLKGTSLSHKTRTTQKDNKALKKAIEFLAFDTKKSKITKWTKTKSKAWLFAHNYEGTRTFYAQIVGIVDKQPTPTTRDSVALRLRITDPDERSKLQAIDAHIQTSIQDSTSIAKKEDAALLKTVLAKAKYVPMLEHGQPKNEEQRETYAGGPIPDDVECFPDTFKIAVDFSKTGDRVQKSRCFDVKGKPIQAVQLQKGNRVLVQFTLNFGTIYGDATSGKKYGMTPHMEESYVLDDSQIESGRDEVASLDDEELERVRERFNGNKKTYLPESTLQEEAKMPAFAAAAKSDAKEVANMVVPPPKIDEKSKRDDKSKVDDARKPEGKEKEKEKEKEKVDAPTTDAKLTPLERMKQQSHARKKEEKKEK